MDWTIPLLEAAWVLAGSLLGVACTELWRWLRPPEELVILRAMQQHFAAPASRSATPTAASRGSLIEAATAPALERFARYARDLRRARAASAAAWGTLGVAFIAGAYGLPMLALALSAAFLCCAVASLRLRRRAARMLEGR